jgi:hypothetical protein
VTLYSRDTITRTCSQLDSVGDLGTVGVSWRVTGR